MRIYIVCHCYTYAIETADAKKTFLANRLRLITHSFNSSWFMIRSLCLSDRFISNAAAAYLKLPTLLLVFRQGMAPRRGTWSLVLNKSSLFLRHNIESSTAHTKNGVTVLICQMIRNSL